MENEQSQAEEQPSGAAGDESVEEFKQEVENDPSTASDEGGGTDMDRLRGG